tara:strand:+ start:107 stop:649 length:543 start_codon:yes stop_codon:yes gene_type:complete
MKSYKFVIFIVFIIIACSKPIKTIDKNEVNVDENKIKQTSIETRSFVPEDSETKVGFGNKSYNLIIKHFEDTLKNEFPALVSLKFKDKTIYQKLINSDTILNTIRHKYWLDTILIKRVSSQSSKLIQFYPTKYARGYYNYLDALFVDKESDSTYVSFAIKAFKSGNKIGILNWRNRKKEY